MPKPDLDSAEPGDELALVFGAAVRKLRDAADMTLEQLSRQSGVSRAMLSKVERGEKSPTIGIATRIAHALNTSLSELVGGSDARGKVVISRRAARPVFRDPASGFERHIVSPAPGGTRVELLYHHLPAGVSTGVLPAYPLGTEKHVTVIEGTLVVEIDGIDHTLERGDAMFFQANVDHTFRNATDAPCGYFLVVSRQA
ncbi:helix-turn-helix domain-containing protein [Burkholderia sp. 22PA0099]|uniref:helix-turn-helix domain-containing protein n=1 Tax=Burkholderia sp. 22PA0099 TaxID=3237372 RepID=UPI0039C00D03